MRSGDDARSGDGTSSVSTDGRKRAVAGPTPAPAAAAGSREDVESADTAVADSDELSGEGPSAASAAEPASAQETLVGQVLLDRYEITRKIGQGGMGAVYEATHRLIGKRVAVKVLLDKHAEKESVVARLELEARLASSIGNEHIIDITDFGRTDDGRTFVVMEYLEGESLASCLRRVGRIEPARAVGIASQIASALGAAHKKGVIHRDVKPENVFMLRRDDEDFVKVVDFGISKSIRSEAEADGLRLTQTGMVLGTPLYMSPEQARGDEDLDHRIDIYALGVILYEIVTGEVPFSGNNYLSVISQVIADEPKRPSEIRPEIGDALEAVILRAMAKDRDERYRSMAELDADLAVLADPNDTGALSRTTAARWRRGRTRRRGVRALSWAAGVVVVAAAVAITVTKVMSRPAVATAGAGHVAAAVAATDAAPAPPPPDAHRRQRQTMILIDTIPPHGTIYADNGVVWIGVAPVKYKAALRKGVIKLSAELHGYATTTFAVSPIAEGGKRLTIRLRKLKRTRRDRSARHRHVVVHRHETHKPHAKSSDDTAGGDLTGNPYTHK